LSKKFIPESIHNDRNEKSFEFIWPTLALKKSNFSLIKEFKEIEEKIIRETKEKVASIEKEAYKKGFKQGENDGRELGLKKLEVVINQLGNVIQELEDQWKQFIRFYAQEMLNLTLSIGKRIFRENLVKCEELIVATLHEAFEYVTERGKVVIHLNPADYHYLLLNPKNLPFSLEEGSGIKLVEDPTITRGGCLLETNLGDIDATFESQFEEIAQVVRRSLDRKEIVL